MSNLSMEKLSRNLGRLTEALEHLQGPRLPSELTDETGQITVELTGERITSLRLGNRWKDSIPPEILGASILSIPLKALLHTTIDALESARESMKPPTKVETSRTFYDFPPSVIDELNDRIAQLRDKTDKFISLPLEERYTAPPENDPEDSPRSRNGKVVAVISGDKVTDLRIDQTWLTKTTTQAICDSVMEALDAAYHQIASGSSPHENNDQLNTAGQSIRNDVADINKILSIHRRLS